MPTYQYECEDCQHSFEALQGMAEPKLTMCPSCGQDSLVRLIGGGSGIIFKGSGFYETDYKTKDAPKEESKPAPAAQAKPAAAPSAPAEA